MFISINKCRAAALALSVCIVVFFQSGIAEAQSGSSVEAAGEKFSTITTDDLARMLPTKDFTLVNVHVPYEGHIEQTDAFVPFDNITNDLSKLPADRRASIVLYCMSGRMSGIAAEALSEIGYSNVSHVAGGMIDWRGDGRDILNSRVNN